MVPTLGIEYVVLLWQNQFDELLVEIWILLHDLFANGSLCRRLEQVCRDNVILGSKSNWQSVQPSMHDVVYFRNI